VQCVESLRVQAFFDGEVDAVASADIERHVEHCAECRALLKDLETVRTVLRRDTGYVQAPPALRAQVMRALDGEESRPLEDSRPHEVSRPRVLTATRRRLRPFWAGALGGAGGMAVAAALALFLVVPRLTNPLADQLVNAHVRSLMPAHLIDVVSTDKHTVKPWFAGHADVSPVVADFEPQGYRLIGGRVDYLDHQRSAVVVYQHGAHVINVFSWADNRGALPDNMTRAGYHLAFWRAGDLSYCAVSDTGWDELSGLVRLLRE
jgi:anti-sigma factor (TIGR02949 family)